MPAGREDVGFLLALASRRWNGLLGLRLAEAGFPEVRASYGALLVPLFEEDGLRLGELARRAELTKQTLTTMARLIERDGLVERRADPDDARATRVFLSPRGRQLAPVAEAVLRDLDAAVTRALSPDGSARLKAALGTLVELDRNG